MTFNIKTGITGALSNMQQCRFDGSWPVRLTVQSRLTLVRGVWEKREKPSNRYSWSSYSITVGLSV